MSIGPCQRRGIIDPGAAASAAPADQRTRSTPLHRRHDRRRRRHRLVGTWVCSTRAGSEGQRCGRTPRLRRDEPSLEGAEGTPIQHCRDHGGRDRAPERCLPRRAGSPRPAGIRPAAHPAAPRARSRRVVAGTPATPSTSAARARSSSTSGRCTRTVLAPGLASIGLESPAVTRRWKGQEGGRCGSFTGAWPGPASGTSCRPPGTPRRTCSACPGRTGMAPTSC